MDKNIVVPHLGDSVIEATIIKWVKQEGDAVKIGETIVELETEKANFEVAAETSGVLKSIARKADDDVEVGDLLGTIETGAASVISEEKEVPEQAAGKPVDEEKQPHVRATPVARNIAEQNRVDLSRITPEGSRITKEDVEKHIESEKEKEQTRQATAQQELPPREPVRHEPVRQKTAEDIPTGLFPSLSQLVSTRERRVKMSRRRRTIAKRLVDVQHTAAILSTFNEVDMSKVMNLRARKKEGFKEKHGVNLGFSSFFVKASVGALKAFPDINAEIQDEEIIYKDYYDIGIAVGAEGGLVVPVIREADRKTFAQIEKELKELAAKAGENTLSLDELLGGTFTITNGGVYGSLMSTPIINPPQVAILGLHKIEQRPVVIDGEVVVRPMMYTALSYDHRIVDGKEAVQFLVKIKELIEDPEDLLVEG